MYQIVPVSEETFDSVLCLCKEYATERNLEWLVHADTWNSLLTQMVLGQTAYVLLRDSVPIGMLLMAKHHHVLNNTLLALTPLVVYIKPEFREGRGMALMLQQIEQSGEECRIVSLSLGADANVKESTLLKHGYKKLETVYIKEK